MFPPIPDGSDLAPCLYSKISGSSFWLSSDLPSFEPPLGSKLMLLGAPQGPQETLLMLLGGVRSQGHP